MELPKDRQLYEGELGTYWFDDDGILNSKNNNTMRGVENITKNALLVKKITHNTPVCTLVYLARSRKPDKATRELVNKVLPELYKAMAIVSSSALGEFVMNFLFRISPPTIPIKVFSGEAEARAWLKQYC
jgi:hypothetical protein